LLVIICIYSSDAPTDDRQEVNLCAIAQVNVYESR